MSHTLWFSYCRCTTRVWRLPYFMFASHNGFILLSLPFCCLRCMNYILISILLIWVHIAGYMYTSSTSSSSLSSSMTCLCLAPIMPCNWAQISSIFAIFFAFALVFSCNISRISSFTSSGTLGHSLVLFYGSLCAKWYLNRVMPPLFINSSQLLQIIPFRFPFFWWTILPS